MISPSDPHDLKARAMRLRLVGLVAHWDEYQSEPWLPSLIEREEGERSRRGLERRIKGAQIGRFKSLADFDWNWPTKIDRELVDEIFSLEFLKEARDVAFLGPSGTGKTTLSQNLVHQAVLHGYTARFVTASQLLNELTSQDSHLSLTRRLKRVAHPDLLAIDEVGYLACDARHADLIFEVVSRRHEAKSTVITTNRAFSEWGAVFPHSSSVVALIDRLVHKTDLVAIEGDSYRLKEAKEREARRLAERAARRKSSNKGSAKKSDFEKPEQKGRTGHDTTAS